MQSPDGTEAIHRSARDREAAKFGGGKTGILWQGPRKKDDRPIGPTSAFFGQAAHALHDLGSNIGSFVNERTPLGVVDSAVQAAAPALHARKQERANQKLSEGQAFVDKTRELGYRNYGGAAVNTAYHLAGLAVPFLRGGKFPFLKNTATQAVTQTGLGAAGAEDGERLSEGATAGVGSAVGDLLVGALARTAKPVWNMTKEAKLLADKGIYATPMSASGGAMKAMEDKVMSIPGAGDILSAGRRAGVKDYNKYLIADAAGGPLPGKGYGRDALDAAMTRFSNRYDSDLKGLLLDINDPSIATGFNQIARNNELDKQGLNTVNQTWNTWRANRNQQPMPITGTNPPGAQNYGQPTYLDGENIQALTQKFGERGTRFQRSTDPYHQQTGDAYNQMREELFNAVRRQGHGSGNVDNLIRTNKDYANFVPIMAAANRAAASRRDGVFSPGEGLSALKQTMSSRGQDRNFLRGRGHNQDVHQAANDVLGSQYPDSGTAGRLAVTSLLLGGGGVGLNSVSEGSPATAPLAALAAYVAASSSRGGRKYMLGQLKGQTALADALRNQYLRKGASALGASSAGEDPSFMNPDQYTPWGK